MTAQPFQHCEEYSNTTNLYKSEPFLTVSLHQYETIADAVSFQHVT